MQIAHEVRGLLGTQLCDPEGGRNCLQQTTTTNHPAQIKTQSFIAKITLNRTAASFCHVSSHWPALINMKYNLDKSHSNKSREDCTSRRATHGILHRVVLFKLCKCIMVVLQYGITDPKLT